MKALGRPAPSPEERRAAPAVEALRTVIASPATGPETAAVPAGTLPAGPVSGT